MTRSSVIAPILLASAAVFFLPACEQSTDPADDDDSAAADTGSDDGLATGDDDDLTGDDDDSSGDRTDSTTNDDDDSSDDDEDSKSEALNLANCQQSPPAGDPFDLGSVSLVGDRLDFSVGYSGGCTKHLFTACWHEMFRTSLPKQVTVSLGHDAKGDICEAYISESYSLDLTPIRSLWEMGNSPPGTIIVRVGDQTLQWSVL